MRGKLGTGEGAGLAPTSFILGSFAFIGPVLSNSAGSFWRALREEPYRQAGLALVGLSKSKGSLPLLENARRLLLNG